MIFTELKPGQTVEGEEIKAYKSDVKASKHVYLIAGVHGDEVEGIYVLSKFFEWLKKDFEFEIPMIVIPIVNMDGLRHSTRTNGHDVDLNRNLHTKDWKIEFTQKKYCPGPKPESEPENQFLVKLLKKYPPSIIFSFHSWKPMINYNGDCKEVAEFLESYTKYPAQDDIGYPTPGSLGTYAVEQFNAPVITFECPTLRDSQKKLDEIWQENEVALKELFASDLLRKYYE